jgi:hypothetical protein
LYDLNKQDLQNRKEFKSEFKTEFKTRNKNIKEKRGKGAYLDLTWPSQPSTGSQQQPMTSPPSSPCTPSSKYRRGGHPHPFSTHGG